MLLVLGAMASALDGIRVLDLTTGPAGILGVPHGTLSVGQAADVTLIDPAGTWTIRANKFHSRSRNTPFDGVELVGKVVTTIVDGEVRFPNAR